MENNEQILKKIYLFTEFADKEILKISGIAKLITVPQGESLC